MIWANFVEQECKAKSSYYDKIKNSKNKYQITIPTIKKKIKKNDKIWSRQKIIGRNSKEPTNV